MSYHFIQKERQSWNDVIELSFCISNSAWLCFSKKNGPDVWEPCTCSVTRKFLSVNQFLLWMVDFIEPSFKLDLVNSYTDEDLIEMIKLLSGESEPEEVMT